MKGERRRSDPVSVSMAPRWVLAAALLLLASVVCVGGEVGDAASDATVDVAVDAGGSVASVSIADETNDPAGKKARSFVTPTQGSAHALTLTTYLTSAAHLHYAVVTAGHPPLDAAAVKAAAEDQEQRKLASDEDQGVPPSHSDARQFSGHNNGLENAHTKSTVAASTVTVPRAQKVESLVQELRANTSYDVYFVAEVINSNGVFGPVQSVLQSSTHPEPPTIDITYVSPANASADTVVINATLSTPGKVYFALVPSGSTAANTETLLAPADLAENRSHHAITASAPPAQFAVHDVGMLSDTQTFQKVVQQLTPATLYDVFVMTEAPGDGQVRSQVLRHSQTARTHALAPEVRFLACSPLDASASALEVHFKLELNRQDILRVTQEALSYFSYDVHYEVTAVNGTAKSKPREPEQPKPEPPATRGRPVRPAARGVESSPVTPTDEIVKGVFFVGGFSSVEAFHASLEEMQHANITGLQSGTLYTVKLRGETTASNGLFGLREPTTQAATHETAPEIVAASAEATNASVNALTFTVELDRPRGNVHYLLTGKSGAAHSLRPIAHQATSMAQLEELFRDPSPTDAPAGYVTGVLALSPNFSENSNTDLNQENDLQTAGDGVKNKYAQQFQIDGLEDETSYSIVLIPETTASFGVFGKAFGSVIETTTNENASAVDLRSAEPLIGNVTGIQLEVDMTKPNDALFLCLTPSSANTTARSDENCREVTDRASFEFQGRSPTTFAFSVGNLSEDTSYYVSLYAENARRNGVVSARSTEHSVRTHKRAPGITQTSATPVAASTSQILASVKVEPASPCLVHYIVREATASTDEGETTLEPMDSETIIKYATRETQGHGQHHRHHSSSSPEVIAAGSVFTEASTQSNATTSFEVEMLNANTTYQVVVVTETSRNGRSSRVFGEPVVFNTTTHAVAPKIVLATVDPVAGSTESVVISVNLSHPGVVHYFLSDVDFADPAVIKRSDESTSNSAPHELRGQMEVFEQDILMEIINGTNDSRPVDPPQFVRNLTLAGLKSGATYHVSLTTETRGSHGVFGEFPPPILVNTNLGAPVIVPETLQVRAVGGSSSALEIDLQLDRFGDVHYALFFRGLVPDRSVQDNNASTSSSSSKADAKADINESETLWPPPSSTFDLTKLNGSMLKAARLEELGVGVWLNDTLTVSREDVLRGKPAHKEVDKLPPNALFDVCLVSETAASGGIFGWPDTGSATACHRVATHADYTNQSVQLDEVAIHALDARTDGVHISLNMSKLLAAPSSTVRSDGNVLERFAQAAGRVPYFLLLDSTTRSRDLGGSSFVSHRGEVTSAFKTAAPGHGDGVVAAGVLNNITNENATALRIEQDVLGLRPNHEYLLFFAYETSGSDGVFTRVNPHKHRSNDSRSENDGLAVTTHEAAPQLSKTRAQPAFGHTTRVSVQFDVVCDACESALVHMLLFPAHCSSPSSVQETLRLAQLSRPNADDCKHALAYKSVEIDMPERQHSRKDVEEEFGDARVLAANTSYVVLLATETVDARGVLSPSFFEPLNVRTHAAAPSFTTLRLTPRSGATTELVLTFALDRPGEVHYMLGVSGQSEFNATSPHNVSSKAVPSKANSGRHGRDAKDSHSYGREVVRMRRSIKFSSVGSEHVELLSELAPGTSYDLLVVVEAAPGDHGVYGDIHELRDVSTLANAPILLAHAAYPTPGTTQALTVGFRMDAPGVVHFSVVSVSPWGPAQHIAEGSDHYGNRLALQDELVAQESLQVDTQDMEFEHDSGWREQTLKIPQPGANYTVHLVTETMNSGGIYGIVATHANVRAHQEAPELLDVSLGPADARVDALTVNVTLSTRGHVHYMALPSGRRFVPPNDDTEMEKTESDVVATGRVDLNDTCDNGSANTNFTLAGLTEGTAYDLYLRSETLGSFGVLGAWTRDAITSRTHGLPPDVLLDAIECHVTPSCEQRGRETVRLDVALFC